MDATTVFMNLAVAAPLNVLAWLAALSKASRQPAQLLFLCALIVATGVPLGGYLATTVGLAFGETLRLGPISWIMQPTVAVQAIAASAIVGCGWGFGIASAIERRETGERARLEAEGPHSRGDVA